MSALRGNQENGIGGKQRTVFKRRCLQLPSRRQLAWKGSTIVLSSSKAADSKRREKFFERKIDQGPQSLWKKIPKTMETPPWRKLYESVMWLLAFSCMSKLHNVNPDGHSAKSAYSSTLRLSVSPTRKSKKSGEKKVLLLYWIIRSKWVAYFKILIRRYPSRFHGRSPNHWDRSAPCTSEKVHYAT